MVTVMRGQATRLTLPPKWRAVTYVDRTYIYGEKGHIVIVIEKLYQHFPDGKVVKTASKYRGRYTNYPSGASATQLHWYNNFDSLQQAADVLIAQLKLGLIDKEN